MLVLLLVLLLHVLPLLLPLGWSGGKLGQGVEGGVPQGGIVRQQGADGRPSFP